MKKEIHRTLQPKFFVILPMMKQTVLIISLVVVVCGLGFIVWSFMQSDGSLPDPDPAQYPVRGIDLSAHNGTIDFNRMASDSLDFVILKATEGASFQDRRFNNAYRQARTAGVKTIGAYHFFRFDTDGGRQAFNFLSSIRGKQLDMPVIIDVEEWTNSVRIPTSIIVDRIKEFVNIMALNGHNVMFYTNKKGYERFIKGRFESHPLWICSFSDPPLGRRRDNRWHLWQYSHKGNVDGIGTDVDLSTFNGTRSEWEDWLRTSTF